MRTMADIQTDLLAILKDGRAVSLTRLCQSIEGRRDRIFIACQALEAAGLIVRREPLRRNSRGRYSLTRGRQSKASGNSGQIAPAPYARGYRWGSRRV